MTEYDPQLGSLPVQDHDHDVLLIAGSRPEVARLAPVATAFADADRIRAITVAAGPDAMAVHEAYEALGVPAEITRMPGPMLGPHPAAVGAMLMNSLDELMVDLDPSAIMVYGGGMTAAMAAQVAFWRQIPVVHLQSGTATDDLLCPFPQEANRRIIGQLASLFLVTRGTAGATVGPNAIAVGDTMAANPQAADLRIARLVRRVHAGLPRLVLVGLDRADSLGVLAGLPDLLENEPDIEVVLYGSLAAHGAAYPLLQNSRATVVRDLPLADLVRLIAASCVLVSDDQELVTDAPGLGTPAVLVDGPHVQEPGDSIRSILSPAVMTTVRQVLAATPNTITEPSDGLEAARVEQAVAWMFGLTSSPLLPAPDPAPELVAEPEPAAREENDSAPSEG
ncbi:UDP-N-acetylglucosamine 2-epimerase [Pseudonocardia humida]|uniref:UDP-N-acetylglucosamine 2-epimerase (non-hydrolyzing) n=1 Tax=Pseudonocardia humida TaxID=2800819 RepID=A0ABT0ZXE3_9PSEU|nr:UDP-N-acetylglucosamine 2-epimerase [Pseudonocardia humida]MCO1655401.1 UDP-N-acetylglucosamine 2-epimerase [Pseudonocardia humida]